MDLRVMHTRDAIHSLHSCLKQSSCTALWGTWSAHCAHPWQPLSLECHPSNTQEDIIDTFLGSTIRVAFSAHTPALLVGCQTKHIAISKGNNAAVQTVLVLGCVSGREENGACLLLWLFAACCSSTRMTSRAPMHYFVEQEGPLKRYYINITSHLDNVVCANARGGVPHSHWIPAHHHYCLSQSKTMGYSRYIPRAVYGTVCCTVSTHTVTAYGYLYAYVRMYMCMLTYISREVNGCFEVVNQVSH